MLIGDEDNRNENLLNLGNESVVFFKVARGFFYTSPIMLSESNVK